MVAGSSSASWAAIAACLIGCGGGERPAEVTPAPVAPPPPGGDRDPSRDCGEPGPTPTDLPDALAAGGVSLGVVTLGAGQRADVAGVTLEYRRDAWIGTTRAGTRGPALITLIPRAEAEGGAWGDQTELSPELELLYDIGPYRFRGRAGAGRPPEEVTVRVVRRAACPTSHVVEATPVAPTWLWVSTEAIRAHTFDVQGVMLQVTALASPHVDGVRYDVSELGFRHWFLARPGETHVIQPPGFEVRFERLEGGDSSHTGHARVRVAPEPSRPLDPPSQPSLPCGALTPGATTRPPELDRAIERLGAFELTPDQTRTELGLEASFTVLVSPARPGREPAPTVSTVRLRVPNASPPAVRSATLGASGPSTWRVGSLLARVEAIGVDPPTGARVEVFRAPCADAFAAPPITATATLWLSSHGIGSAVIAAQGSPSALQLRLDRDGDRFQLSGSSEHGHFSSRVTSDLVGHALTLDDVRIQVAAVVAGDGTRFEGDRLISDAAAPSVHVALHLEPRSTTPPRSAAR